MHPSFFVSPSLFAHFPTLVIVNGAVLDPESRGELVCVLPRYVVDLIVVPSFCKLGLPNINYLYYEISTINNYWYIMTIHTLFDFRCFGSRLPL